MFATHFAIVSGVLGPWPPPDTRFILNKVQGASMATGICQAQFNTPCAIEKVHQMAYDLAAEFESAATTEAFDGLVAAVNAKEYNQPVLFWPVVLNISGQVLATGAEASADYDGPPYVGGFYQDILLHEGRHVTADLGGVFQNSLWADIQAAADADGYFFSNGKDGYHETSPVEVLQTVDRVNYVRKVATVSGEVYVISAFSDMPVSDPFSTSNCTADKDALCSITNVRGVLGNVVTAMIKARDPSELDAIFAAVSNKQYNRYYEGWYTGFYPFVWGMSGLGYAHGANNQFVGSYLNSSARLEVPKLATLHADLAEAGLSGGGYTAYYWNNYAGEEMYLKVSFTVGVRRFGTEYYIGVGYTHESDAIVNPVPGPHDQPCSIATNQPCAFTNVLNLVGHVQTLCFASNMFPLSSAFNMTTYDPEYFYAQPAGFSSAYRNYAFIYDYNSTNVAHGANPGLVGRKLPDIISGVARFDGILNGTELNEAFVAAAEAGGAWVAYPWINAGDDEPYDKLAYLVKIASGGREYYLGVGLSDVPLVDYDLPCLPFFSDACAEDWALSVAGVRMSGILDSADFAEVQAHLASPYENTAPLRDGGSPYGFETTVFTNTLLLASAHWEYNNTADWLLAAGLASDAFALEAPDGVWLGPLTLRTRPGEALAPHYLYHITLGVTDDVADGELDGIHAIYHVIVPVKEGPMPPLYDAQSACAALACVGHESESGCAQVVGMATGYEGGGEVELCECDPASFVVKDTLVRWESNFSVNWSYPVTPEMGVAKNLQATHSLACEAVWMPAEGARHHYFPEALVYLTWAVNFILYAFGIFCAAWTYANRRVALVAASQPVFLYLIILGSLISLAAVFPLSMDHEDLDPQPVGANATGGVYPSLDVACNSVVWLYSIGFALSFGSLFAKLWRVKTVLINPSMRNVKISLGSLLRRLGALLAVQLVILVAWVIVDPMYFKVDIDATDELGRVTESHGHCVTGDAGIGFLFALLGINLALLLYGNLLVYQARAVPTKYHEGKYISFCVANNLQTTMFAILLSLFIYDTPIAFFIIKWMAILACDAGTLLLIFVPKMIIVRHGGSAINDSSNKYTSGGGTMQGHTVDDSQSGTNKSGGGGRSFGPKVGPEPDELAELRAENEELRDQVYRLRGGSRASKARSQNGETSMPVEDISNSPRN